MTIPAGVRGKAPAESETESLPSETLVGETLEVRSTGSGSAEGRRPFEGSERCVAVREGQSPS